MARLLLVDPDAARRTELALEIRQLGHAVIDLRGPVEALQAVEKADVDLVLASVDELGGPGRPLARALGARSREILVWIGPSEVLKKVRRQGAPLAGLLPSPPPSAALEGLLARLVGDSGPSWSGRTFLATVDGSARRFPVPRVLFLAHRLGASGVLTVQGDGYDARIVLRDGRVCSVDGVLGLIPEVVLPASAGLEQVVGMAIGRGMAADEALEAAAVGLGRWAVGVPRSREVEVRFDVGGDLGAQGFPLPLGVPRLLARGLAEVRDAAAAQTLLERFSESLVKVEVPQDAPESRWGLPPLSLRLVREAARVPSLGSMIGSRTEAWQAVDLLFVLGFLSLDDAVEDSTVLPEDMPTEGPVEDDSVIEEESSALIGFAFAESSEEVRTQDESRLAPSVEAKAPAPVPPAAEDPDEGTLLEMQKSLSELRRASAVEILAISHSSEANPDGIEASFRRLSASYHPDRFANNSREVQNLAADCFALLGRAREQLTADTDGLEILGKRLLAAEEGRVFLTATEREQLKHRVRGAHKAFQRKDWKEAIETCTEALELDPEIFEASFLLVQARVRSGAIEAPEAVTLLSELAPPSPQDRAAVRYTMGTLLMKAGQERRAYKHFQEAVDADPDHIEAKRHLRLRDMRKGRGGNDKAEGGDLGSRIAGFFRRGK